MSIEGAIDRRLEEIRLSRRVKWILYLIFGVFFFAAIWGSMSLIEFSVGHIADRTPFFLETVTRYVPNWDVIWERNLPREAGITLAIGFLGTVLSFPFALILGILGSGRVTPFPFNFIFRSVMGVSRAIPALVWFLFFLPLTGLTALTATVAVTVSSIGNLGRLFTDELEEIRDGPIEAMRTTGASKWQVVVFGMLSQVRTPFIAWTLYILEINVRVAVTIGLLGGGGIGEFIEVQQGLRAFSNMMSGILVVLVLILAVEMVSQRIRSYLRAEDEAQGLVHLIVRFPERMAESIVK